MEPLYHQSGEVGHNRPSAGLTQFDSGSGGSLGPKVTVSIYFSGDDRNTEEAIVNRCRISLAVLLLLIAPLGYWLRFDAPIAAAARDGLGGAAYVVFFVVAVAIVIPASPAARIALIVLAVTCALEFLQLWHPPWLETIRRTFTGRVLLGTTFDWSDFPPYFAGALIGWMLVRLHQRIWRQC